MLGLTDYLGIMFNIGPWHWRVIVMGISVLHVRCHVVP